jgi:formylglycine-generating enzyme required for sulfatase activity
VADAVSDYLGSLRASLDRSLRLTGVRNHTPPAATRIPTFLAVDVRLEGGHPTQWRMRYDPSSPRSLARPNYSPLFGAATLQTLVAEGAFDLVDEQVRQRVATLRAQGARPPGVHTLLHRPVWEDGLHTGLLELTVADLLAGAPRTVVVGPAGSGKSTILRQYSLDLAERAAFARGRGEPAAVPLHLEGRHLVPLVTSSPADWSLDLDGLCRIVTEQYELPPGHAPALRDHWLDHPLVLVLDAVDETMETFPRSEATYETQFLSALVSFVAGRPGARLVASSRQRESLESFKDVVPVEIAPMSQEEMLDLVVQQVELDEGQRGVLRRLLTGLPDDLRTRPLFALLGARIAQGRTGHSGRSISRVRLLDLGLEQLVTAPLRATREPGTLVGEIGCDYPTLLRGLQQLADATLPAPAQTADGDVSPVGLRTGVLLDIFEDLDNRVNVTAVIRLLSEKTGLLRSEARRLHFAHSVFRAHLAAGHLRVTGAGDRRHRPLLDRLSSAEAFRDVAILYLARLRDQADANGLLDLCDAALERAADDGPDAARHVWLAAMAVRDVRGLQQRWGRRDTVVFDEFTRLAVTWIGNTRALPAPDRVLVAEQVGRLGDPRPGVGVHPDERPDLTWVSIPSGVYTLGLSTGDFDPARMPADERLRREMPARSIRLDSFRIAAYPVTWGQFLTFVRDPAGYRAEKWWAGLAPANDADSRARRCAELADTDPVTSVPVHGVDWYEANAWCRWASDATGEDVRLPSEEEWEVAARGPQKWLYPWGDQWDPNALNWEGLGLGRIVPVGCFASSPGPWEEGLWDLLGNVWEWTTSVPDQRFGPVDGAVRVVRGTCYLNGRRLIRATYRGCDAELARFQRHGFRVVSRV